ncbi:class I SAM-dependent methyltransferase [Sciscionella sediminilitoris]|uniref:class I SAM-dependent methyltransferase n=1 Tax=Sciscionella sediminilitoris TaxID=1445613 RepID=UPI0004DF3E1E|nr:methyltransferase [Sciscionella sp. SE31]
MGHYFSQRPEARSRPGVVPVRAGELDFELGTDAGVFAKDHLDKGTAVLLDEMPWPDTDGTVLDLGCGYGPIACALALHRPGSRVYGIDTNERAIELTRANAERLGAANLTACAPDEVPDALRFDYLYSNPPVRIGKAALHELLLRWLSRLTEDGRAYLVVQRNLGSDSLAAWLIAQGYPTERLASHRGFRVLEVTARTSEPQQG